MEAHSPESRTLTRAKAHSPAYEGILARGASQHFLKPTKTGDMKDANFPMDGEGRVYHLGIKRGEVCNRILSVGSTSRANLLSKSLDKVVFELSSTRGFVIYTGLKNGVPITIIATGMGFPMMDFVVRECRAVVEGTMVVARYGTCGTPHPDVPIGSIVVASEGSLFITRNVDAFLDDELDLSSPRATETFKYYNVSKTCPSDPKLSALIVEALRERVPPERKVVEGLNATADSFYSSQGRVIDHFADNNDSLIEDTFKLYPSFSSLEMETFHLFHMAHCSRGTLKASAAVIVLAQRLSNEFLDKETTRYLEVVGGTAVLEALSRYELNEEETMSGDECVWLKGK